MFRKCVKYFHPLRAVGGDDTGCKTTAAMFLLLVPGGKVGKSRTHFLSVVTMHCPDPVDIVIFFHPGVILSTALYSC